jgi:hypothetical protein
VQVFPGLRTVLGLQVPPVMENDPGPESWVMPVPIFVTGPEVVAFELLTVIVPDSDAPMKGVVGANVGMGALNVITPCSTLNPTALVRPAVGVVTVTL